jgi:large subunit ribosomal protein L7Ae
MVSPYEIVELARKTGKIDKGVNEVTKAIERATAKLVVYAEDVSPKEIVQYLPVLCQEKGIVCQGVDSRKKLGISAGIGVACTAVAIIEPGDALKHLAELGIKIDPERKKERTKK